MTSFVTEVADHNRIVNVDESPWRVHPTTPQTWAFRDAQNISVQVADNANNSFTLVTAIPAARMNLPLLLIAAVKGSPFGMLPVTEPTAGNQGGLHMIRLKESSPGHDSEQSE
jgi:hypothetical protein